eukprot:5258663-Pleurochrysis_carterae.AAC.1
MMGLCPAELTLSVSFCTHRAHVLYSKLHSHPTRNTTAEAVVNRLNVDTNVGDLNVDKQLHNQALRRHLDVFTAEKVSALYAGMGVKIDLARKDSRRSENWFKAAERDSTILGNAKFPGGVATWLPNLVRLVGECMLGARARIAQIRRLPFSLAAPRRGYGSSLAKTLILVLRGYDAYHDWRKTLDLMTTSNENSKKATSLRIVKLFHKSVCLAAVKLTAVFDNAADANGKKMFHIIMYIIPRQVARRGNLWKLSTGKLKARGAQCKRVVRRQTCARPRALKDAAAQWAAAGRATGRATIRERGGTQTQKKKSMIVTGATEYKQSYDSSQMQKLLGMIALQAARAQCASARLKPACCFWQAEGRTQAAQLCAKSI